MQTRLCEFDLIKKSMSSISYIRAKKTLDSGSPENLLRESEKVFYYSPIFPL